jgi:uncharacterized phage infection (PIP) family protein YhgE
MSLNFTATESRTGDVAGAFAAAMESANSLAQQAGEYDAQTKQLTAQISQMANQIDIMRQAYQEVCDETAKFESLHERAKSRLADVQRTTSRYLQVKNPVVASDGFTYDREVIERYFKDCLNNGEDPTSQQNKSKLDPTQLIPNQSLKKLLELLDSIKPDESEVAAGAAASRGAAIPHHTAIMRDPSIVESRGPSSAAATSANGGRLHPCLRVFGQCNYGDNCTFAHYPYDACLSYIKGKCRFGSQCHEQHVNLKDYERARPAVHRH